MSTDKKISELPVASSVSASDISVLVNSGTDYQYTFTTLLQFLQANLTTGANLSFGTVLPQNTTGKNGDVFVNTASGSFAQKTSGAWTIVYTLPAANAADGTLLYGTGLPGIGTGKDLDSYINTLTGIFYKKTSGTWSQVFSMATGPQGPRGLAGTNGTNGTDGNTLLFGTTNPSNTLTGVNGNFYINTSTYKLFGPKTAGVWGSGTSLLGVGIPTGGTTGQVLVKIDGTDYNTDWQDNSFANLSGSPADNTNLAAALVAKQDSLGYTAENTANKNSANGYAGLDGSGKVASAQLPSYVDDIVEFANFAALPATGETGKIYVILDTNAEYRWSGSTYIQLVASPGSTDAIPEGSTNKYFTAARVLATLLTGIGFSSATAINATDTILGALGKLQAQFTALFKIPAGGTTGQVLAKVDGGDGNTHWIDVPSGSGGSSGVSGFTPNEVLFGKSDGTIQQDPAFDFDPTTKSLYVDVVETAPNGTAYFYGTSITHGFGLSDIDTQAYYALVAEALGFSIYVDGENNSTLEKRAPIDGNGGTNMVDRLANIPTKTSSDKLMVFEFGVNDLVYGGVNYNPTNFKLDYEIVINNAISKGWSGSDMVLLSIGVIPDGNYGATGAGGEVITFANHMLFNAAINDVCTEYGATYVDIYQYMLDRGGIVNLGISVHPNALGHYMMACSILDIIGKTVYQSGQGLAVNKIAEFSDIKLKPFNILPDTGAHAGQLLGIDKDGNLGIMNALYDGIRFLGTTNFTNVTLGNTAPPTAGYGVGDIGIQSASKMWGVFGAIENYLQLTDTGGKMNIGIPYLHGALVLNMHDGQIFFGSDCSISTPANINALSLRNDGGGGTYGSFEPFTASQTYIRNSVAGGFIRFGISGGVNGAQKIGMQINSRGRIILQSDVVDDDMPLSRLTINSAKEGFLIPRMTTTQRDAMCSLSGFYVNAYGSGYTTASLSFTGGGGTGAAGTLDISGGKIVNANITSLGTGYTSVPTAVITGDGTGAALHVDFNLAGHEGLQIYNLDTHKINFYDGSSWQQLSSTPA